MSAKPSDYPGWPDELASFFAILQGSQNSFTQVVSRMEVLEGSNGAFAVMGADPDAPSCLDWFSRQYRASDTSTSFTNVFRVRRRSSGFDFGVAVVKVFLGDVNSSSDTILCPCLMLAAPITPSTKEFFDRVHLGGGLQGMLVVDGQRIAIPVPPAEAGFVEQWV